MTVEKRDGKIVVVDEREKGPDGRKKKRGGPYEDNAYGRIKAAKRVTQVMQEQQTRNK